MSIELSIICPTLNERRNIEALTRTFQAADGLSKEIIYVDGGSTDGTREKIQELQTQYSNVLLVDNPDRYVSKGFNKAYAASSGRYIAFVGAHTHYADDYFSRGVQCLRSNECDVVGGFLLYEGRTATGKAIAYCMSNKFGVGGNEFRTEKKRKYVQSVSYAIYKREIFETCGLMNEELIVNQDDEFHYRIHRAGYRILMAPDMHATYFVRDSLKALSRQYFRYGLYKPLVLKKVITGFKLRHLIPALFFIYLLSLPLSLWFFWWIVPFLLYLFLALFFALRSTLTARSKWRLFLVFPILHVSSGAGSVLGMLKL